MVDQSGDREQIVAARGRSLYKQHGCFGAVWTAHQHFNQRWDEMTIGSTIGSNVGRRAYIA